jgi:hypothetical protein
MWGKWHLGSAEARFPTHQLLEAVGAKRETSSAEH